VSETHLDLLFDAPVAVKRREQAELTGVTRFRLRAGKWITIHSRYKMRYALRESFRESK
jgi:hypothetical protein